ncbi:MULTISPECIES: ABC transporter substrate-binding protein [unclassified Chelatococcus]|uniref:ABC transporter substrate-binding protein n=1 Tax=unclassified Chelatococcus TaxID=2638111 RepID=UPI001BCEDE5B|nr:MULTISPECIES: ABC transporter substrate-binding protein [unclassified Chelatococcus]MBS7742518.1 ABC transporter substrate-binding protein [Chelatococcus sp. HY11]CAH1656027.1 Sulfonate transport system substrate-binding protein [Hyphomicrobiales bacterium]CAH1695715.1 Sulfonate transport system substrate-binding protein [Hyphomicrobiales bacterium]
MINRRILIKSSAVFAAGVFAPHVARSQDAGTTVIRIGTSNTFGFASTFKARGDDVVPGFRFEIVPFTIGSPQIIAALNAGELDIGEIGEVGPVVAQAANVPFKIVAATEPWGRGQGIIVKADSPIKTISDLRGKKVSYVRGTNSHWVYLKALEKAGLKPDDATPVFLPAGSNIQAVLDSGGIDAAVSIDTLLTAFKKSGSREIANGADVGAENPLYYIASDDAISKRKAGVAAFVKQLAGHLAWGHARPEERAKAVATLLSIDPEVALIAERNRPPRLRPIDAGLKANNQRISDAFLAQGIIEQKLDAAASFTEEFNAYARS